MSRCFPFPPPGYEKKARRTDDLDLLKKEKHKEKKHKKEKKDKEKKEKREKEGKDGKHKEKKDKKEKHREKKKDKDKDRDKDKSKFGATDDKGFSGHGQDINAGKLHQKEISKVGAADDKGFLGQGQGANASKLHQKEISKLGAAGDKGFSEQGQGQGANASKLHQKEIKPNDKKGVLSDNKLTKQYANNNGEKARENNHLLEGNKDSKLVLELDKRIRDNDGGSGTQLAQKFPTSEHRKDEGTVRLVAKGSGTWPDGKERLQDRGIDSKKIDGRGIWAEARPIGNATVQSHAGNFHPRVDGMARPLEKNFNKTLEATIEAKERIEEKRDDKLGDKRKDKEKKKKGHGKDKDRDKKKKKEEKVKENTEHKNREQNKIKENNKAAPLGSNSLTQVPRHINENSIVGENPKKRKDIESNGVLHANENWPSKLTKSSPSHLITENGRMLDPCQSFLLNASAKLGAAANIKVDNKERKINGIIEGLPFAVSSNKNKTATVTVTADPVSEDSKKPPHPDAKYLSQVYSVPKVNECSDFDNEEWLFGSSQERKPVVKSSEVGDTLQVWEEGVHIEPADIFALPYVIPY